MNIKKFTSFGKKQKIPDSWPSAYGLAEWKKKTAAVAKSAKPDSDETVQKKLTIGVMILIALGAFYILMESSNTSNNTVASRMMNEGLVSDNQEETVNETAVLPEAEVKDTAVTGDSTTESASDETLEGTIPGVDPEIVAFMEDFYEFAEEYAEYREAKANKESDEFDGTLEPLESMNQMMERSEYNSKYLHYLAKAQNLTPEERTYLLENMRKINEILYAADAIGQ